MSPALIKSTITVCERINTVDVPGRTITSEKTQGPAMLYTSHISKIFHDVIFVILNNNTVHTESVPMFLFSIRTKLASHSYTKNFKLRYTLTKTNCSNLIEIHKLSSQL